MKPVRVGLIGVGSMGRNHLRVLSMLNSVSLEFIHDVDTARTRQLAAAHQVPASEDLEAALAKVDAAVICSPTVHHAAHVRLAAKHVRHIFVEKPLADTLGAARSVAELAGQAKLNLQVGFIERFNPAVQLLGTILAKSQQVVNVDFTRTNRLSARITDVDVVADLMIHDIDLALHINGPVGAVSASGVRGGGMIDFASVTLSHVNGRFSRVLASRITEKKIRAIHATCTDMYVDCDLLRKEIVISRQSQIRNVPGEPYTITATEDTVAVAPEEALLVELRAFIATCQGEARPGVPDAAAGLAAMDICERVREAIAP